jgi:restriction system protein
MAKETLFSILLRAPWWMSVLAALPLFGAVQLFLPPIAALFATFPFLGIAAFAAWRQLRAPGAANVAEILGKLRDMPWENFSVVIAEALTRDGYAVTATGGGAADFSARKDGRLALVSCKRWKVAQTGAGPLRELLAAKQSADAQDCIYVSTGGFTDNAREFANKNAIRLLRDAELAKLVARVTRAGHRWKLF